MLSFTESTWEQTYGNAPPVFAMHTKVSRKAIFLQFHLMAQKSSSIYGKNKIGAFHGISATVINIAVVENITDGCVMSVSVKTEQKIGKFQNFLFKKTADIVVKLLGARRRMHCNYCGGSFGGKIFNFVLYKRKVGHCRGVVILPAVCVEAHKTHKTRRERKILLAENLFIHFLTRSEAVVIANEGNTRFVELSEHIAHPYKLFCLAKIGKIAKVNYEINLLAGIYVAYHVAGIVISSLCIAYDSKANRIAAFANSFYFAYVLFVEVRVAMYSPIIGMIFELVATR